MEVSEFLPYLIGTCILLYGLTKALVEKEILVQYYVGSRLLGVREIVITRRENPFTYWTCITVLGGATAWCGTCLVLALLAT